MRKEVFVVCTKKKQITEQTVYLKYKWYYPFLNLLTSLLTLLCNHPFRTSYDLGKVPKKYEITPSQ